jgi:hypothetical protein
VDHCIPSAAYQWLTVYPASPVHDGMLVYQMWEELVHRSLTSNICRLYLILGVRFRILKHLVGVFLISRLVDADIGYDPRGRPRTSTKWSNFGMSMFESRGLA